MTLVDVTKPCPACGSKESKPFKSWMETDPSEKLTFVVVVRRTCPKCLHAWEERRVP